MGAAVVTSLGLGFIEDFSRVKSYIPVDAVYEPDGQTYLLYEKYYGVFRQLYKANKKFFGTINGSQIHAEVLKDHE